MCVVGPCSLKNEVCGFARHDTKRRTNFSSFFFFTRYCRCIIIILARVLFSFPFFSRARWLNACLFLMISSFFPLIYVWFARQAVWKTKKRWHRRRRAHYLIPEYVAGYANVKRTARKVYNKNNYWSVLYYTNWSAYMLTSDARAKIVANALAHFDYLYRRFKCVYFPLISLYCEKHF